MLRLLVFSVFIPVGILYSQPSIDGNFRLVPFCSPFQADDNDGRCNKYYNRAALGDEGIKVLSWMNAGINLRGVWMKMTDKAGEKIRGPFKINKVPVSVTDLATDGKGRFAVVWAVDQPGESEQICFRLYDAAAQPVSPVSIVAELKNYWGLVRVAMSADSKSIVIWRPKIDDRYYLEYQLFNRDQRIGDIQRIEATENDHNIIDFDVAMDESGNFTVVWHQTRGGYTNDFYFQRFSADGTALAPPAQSTLRFMPFIQMADDGEFMLWDFNEFQWYDAQGQPQGLKTDHTILQPYQELECCLTPEGHVLWFIRHPEEPGSTIHGHLHARTGEPLADAFVLNDGPDHVGRMSIDADMNSNGELLVTWLDYREGSADVYYQAFDENLSPAGGNKRCNQDAGSASQTVPAVAANRQGQAFVVWQDDRRQYADILGRKVDRRGHKTGPVIAVNDSYESGLAGTERKTSPEIDRLDNNLFGIVFKDRYRFADCFRGQIYHLTSGKSDTNFWVDGENERRIVKGTARLVAGNNRFAIIWEQVTPGHFNQYHIWFRMFDKNGGPLGESVNVAGDTMTSRTPNPCAGFDRNDGFVIAWTDQYKGRKDVYIKKYDRNGQPDGPATCLTCRRFPQRGQFKVYDIIVRKNGSFTVFWRETHDEIQHMVYQNFLAGGPPAGDVNIMSDTPVGNNARLKSVKDDDGTIAVLWLTETDLGNIIFGQMLDKESEPIGRNFVFKDMDMEPLSMDFDFVNRYVYTVWHANNIPEQDMDAFMRVDFLNMPPGPPKLLNPVHSAETPGALDFPFTGIADEEKDKLDFSVQIAADSLFQEQIPASPFESLDDPTHFTPRPPFRVTENDTVRFTLTNRPAPGVYWWRVRALDPMNAGKSSQAQRFRIFETDVHDRQRAVRNFFVSVPYPNPFNARTLIRIEIPYAGRVTCTLFDITGREAGVIFEKEIKTGIHNLTLDARNHASGIYFLRVEAGGFSKMQKCVLIK